MIGVRRILLAQRWSPRVLPAVAVVAFSAAFIGWAAADPAPRAASPADGAASPGPSGAVTVAPPGSASPSSRDAETPAAARPPRPATTTAEPTPPGPHRSIFTRADPPPDGVPARIGVSLSGPAGCRSIARRPGAPAIVTTGGAVELPAVAGVCAVNFDPSAPVRVTVTPPGGPDRTTDVSTSGPVPFDASFVLRASDPVGTYRVRAEQGARVAVAEIVVVTPTAPRLWRDARTGPVRAGDGIELILAGFPAGRPATLHLYGFDEPNRQASYRTSFTVPADAQGTAHVTVATPSTLRTGCFVMATDGVRAVAEATDGDAVAVCVTGR
jgi:hypothetical protein